METSDVADLLRTLRRVGGEPEDVEVKSGQGGFPTSVRETLVAFANTGGGTLLVGVDERAGFAVVDLPDVMAHRDALVALAREAITPPLQIETKVVEIEGGLVLAAQVEPARVEDKPVYVTSKGITNGSYLRTGDGDRRMSEGEIALLFSARSQPQYDREPVPGTSVEDLNRESVLRTLQRVRSNSASLARADEHVVLHRLGVLSEPQPDSVLTLAGLLTFGEFPQHLFPQLMVSVVVYPPEGDRSVRFLDNATLRGSLPELVEDALAVLRRNLAARAVMSGTGRQDRLEYPLEAIREALVNAVMHRDYSPVTRGTQVQVELHPDRLTIRSPGGLYGALVVDDLGENGVSSSRNATLAALLSDTFMPRSVDLVGENRASGIPTMIGLARESGLPRPTFASSVISFVVTMGRSQLLGPDVHAWIDGLHADLPRPSSAHEIALAMMRTGYITNAMLREWGVDRLTATQVLRDLVDQRLAVREGGRRYARYGLDPSAGSDDTASSGFAGPHAGTGAGTKTGAGKGPGFAGDVEVALRSAGSATAARLQEQTGMPRNRVLRHLRAAIASGVVEADGAPRSPKRRYRWVGPPTSGKDQE